MVETFEPDFGNYIQYNFTVGFDLGIEDLEDVEEVLNVFPNPNDGTFDVELSGNVGTEAELQIYDIMGREVIREKMNAKYNFASARIELPWLQSGHYIIKVVTGTGVYTKEFVKQ